MTVDSALALPRRVLLYCLPVLSLVALAISAYLLWLGKDAAAGCGNSAVLDCESVLTSRWAEFLRMPVSLPAVLLYGGLLIASLAMLFAKSEILQRQLAGAVLLFSVMAGGAGLWFIGLQLFSISGFCPYCLAVHACGLTLAGLSILLCIWEGGVSIAKPILGSFVGLLVLIGGQLAVEPRSINLEQVADLSELTEADLSMPPAELPETEEKKVSLGSSYDPPEVDFLKIPEEKPEEIKPATVETTKPDQTPDKAPEKNVGSSVNIAFLDDSANPEGESLDLPDSSDPEASPESTEGTDDLGSAPKKVIAKRLDSFMLQAPAAIDGKLALFEGKLNLNLNEVIVLGSPKAPHIVVELFDYSCHHCRALHWRMEEVRRRYGDQLAIVMLPVPMNAGCNPSVKETAEVHGNACLYARLAIAVWQKRPSKFQEFHARLIEGTDLPEPGQMRYEAGRILGAKELDDALLSDSIDNQMKTGLLLYKICRMGTIPKLILGDAIATGKFDKTDELFGLFESKLGLKPLDTQ